MEIEEVCKMNQVKDELFYCERQFARTESNETIIRRSALPHYASVNEIV